MNATQSAGIVESLARQWMPVCIRMLVPSVNEGSEPYALRVTARAYALADAFHNEAVRRARMANHGPDSDAAVLRDAMTRAMMILGRHGGNYVGDAPTHYTVPHEDIRKAWKALHVALNEVRS